MLRERCLAFGPAGSGKTSAWLKIAAAHPEMNFHVIDTDDSVNRMLTLGFPEICGGEPIMHKDKATGLTVVEGGNVKAFTCFTWPDCETAWKKGIRDSIRPLQDWIVVDFCDSTWDWVQNYYVEEVFHEDVGDYFLEVRKAFSEAKKKPSAEEMSRSLLDGWTDWRVINKIYQSVINPICYQSHAHVFLTAKAAKLSIQDKKDVKDKYSQWGLRPEGEKRMAYRVETELLFTSDREGWHLSTIKDRERERHEYLKLRDFNIQYMGATAGWE